MTIVQNRRDFIGIAAGVALATGAAGALAQGAPKAEYAIKKLPFDPARIKGLSEKLLVSHRQSYSSRGWEEQQLDRHDRTRQIT